MRNETTRFPIFSQDTTRGLLKIEMMKIHERLRLVNAVSNSIENEELRREIFGSLELLEVTVVLMIETIMREKKNEDHTDKVR